MASVVVPFKFRNKIVSLLCETFPHVDGLIVQEVAENCAFNVDKAADILAEMSSGGMGNFQEVNKKVQPQNGSMQSYVQPRGKYDHIIEFIQRGYKILILLRGLPGSGKSTLAATLLQKTLGVVNKDEFILSTDDYFWRTGNYIYKVEELEEAHACNQRRCYASMKRGVSPIFIDNTNLEMWEMKVYCAIAVKFGYIIETATPDTAWALVPKMLAKQNTHGVEKDKIRNMLARFQQNVSVQQLFKEFQLSYEEKKMPQLREYPPINESPPPFNQLDVAAGSASTSNESQREYSPHDKKQAQMPIEYVHKFQMKRDSATSTPTKKQVKTADELLTVTKETTYNDSNNEDLISFINEYKQAPQEEEPVKSIPVEQIQKQLEENKVIMSKMMDLFKLTMENRTIQPTTTKSDEKITTQAAETEMEVVHDDNMEDDKHTETQDLEQENKALRNLLAKKTSEKKQLEIDRVNMFFNTNPADAAISNVQTDKDQCLMNNLDLFLTNRSTTLADSPNDFEFIENITSPQSQQVAPTVQKTQKAAFPKFEHKAWGLAENALVSWEIPPPPSCEPLPEEEPVTVETRERATNTTAEDFKHACSSGSSGSMTRVVARGDPISKEKKSSNNFNLRKKITLDKGCMTDEDELLMKVDCQLDVQVKKLIELFPGVPLESILDVYDKCGKDINWTVDIISTSPTDLPTSSNKPESKKKTSNNPFSFRLNDWNLTSSSDQEVNEQALKRKQEEEAALQLKKREEERALQLKKRDEEIALQLKKQEEVMQLKQQLEKSVNIGKEHYSDHLWQIRSVKLGIPSEPVQKPDSPELMTIDDDTVYVSDENSDTSSESDEMPEDLVEVNLGNDLIRQLEAMFGQLMLGDDFKPVVQMPESLARQLHALYLESICRQIENQSEYISSQVKEDEEFAMKLQEKERASASGNNMNEIMDEELAMSLYRKDVEQWKNLSLDTLALKLTRQKLHSAFPTIEKGFLDEILVAHGNNYRETVEAIMNSTDQIQMAQGSRENLMQPPISETTLREMKIQEQHVNKVTDEDGDDARSATSYRDEANQHMEKRRELLDKVQHYQQKRNFGVAMFYRNLAEKALKNAELANQLATQRFIHENAQKIQKGDTLDLHFLFVKSAIASLDIFLDYQISNLKSKNKPSEYYYVITGRGNRSQHGKSKLKPAVIRRLKKRKIQYTQMNPGMLRIKVLKNLPMSTDVERPSSD